MNADLTAWFIASNADEVPSPALLVFPERVEENIRRMIAIAGGVERLRPHLKTHKLAEIVAMQLKRGITKVKCATIAEAEMAASAGAPDVLLAYQPVGPNVARMANLVARFPATQFSAVADDGEALAALSAQFSRTNQVLAVLLDLDCGMHRTGLPPGPEAVALYERLCQLPGLKAGGLHAYDGHIHDTLWETRAHHCEEAFRPVAQLAEDLRKRGLPIPSIVAGGTPTFPLHARRPGVDCSPGTCVLWDASYSKKLPDEDFLCAAVLLTRVVSKPGAGLLCLDLGHKAVAAENLPPRVIFPELPDARAVMHSEEHLVIETSRAGDYPLGSVLYGIPWHICPTVALHAEAVIVQNGRATTRWKVEARARTLTI